MSSLLAEINIPAGSPVPALGERMGLKLGSTARHMMDSQSLFLAFMADQLVERSGLAPGPGISIYCILEVSEHDSEAAAYFANSSLPVAKIFEQEVAPMRSLRRMPVAQVFWGGLSVQAEGAIRIFTGTDSAKNACEQQMRLDFSDGICDRALMLSCRMNPWQVWGQAWATR